MRRVVKMLADEIVAEAVSEDDADTALQVHRPAATASLVMACAATAKSQYLDPTAHLLLRAWNTLSTSQYSEDGDTVKVENVLLEDKLNSKSNNRDRGIEGTFHITAASLVFVAKDGLREIWLNHSHIRELEKGPWSQKGNPLTIRSKTFLHVTFYFKVPSDREAVYASLLKESRISVMEKLPCFAEYNLHVQTEPSAPSPVDLTGWKFFNLEAEFLRLGVPNKNWSQWQSNVNWEVCDTYPQLLYVPSAASGHTLLGSSRFRSRGRMPVLSYLHRDGQAALCRCSQPLAGFSARCKEDEDLLQAICDANPNDQANSLYVVDTRPMVNAMANRAQGKGYETVDNYRNMKFRFFDIDNIHVMRNSQEKLSRACADLNCTASAFLSAVEKSGWLRHVRSVLEAAQFVAARLEAGHSVLVHCSDGWDRTAQTCSLAQILLDPYYRTITGLQALIEKEWLWFGHKFSDRCGHIHKPGDSKSEASEQSPIFAQFLEALWQLQNRFPTAFQFNERLLLALHDEASCTETGTFVGNCAKDRVDLRVAERTPSFWGRVLLRHKDFLNPLYRPPLNGARTTEQDILWLCDRPFVLGCDTGVIPIPAQTLQVWRGLYNRWDSSKTSGEGYLSSVHPKELWLDSLSAIQDNSEALTEHCDALQTRINQLCQLLGLGTDEVSALPASESLLSLDLVALASAPTKLNGAGAGAGDDTESGFEDGSCSSMSKSLSTASDPDSASCSASADQLLLELRSVSLDWARPRSAQFCAHPCLKPFEYHTRKYNCWCCGKVFCAKCVEQKVRLAEDGSVANPAVLIPGLGSKVAPLCTTCRKKVQPQRKLITAT